MSSGHGWIGVDLDGTLAEYNGWKDVAHIGPPIPKMVERIREWIRRGQAVRIFTARVYDDGTIAGGHRATLARGYIRDWCWRELGFELPITCQKDFGMIELWDDRAVRVVANTGERCCAADGH